MFPYFKSRRSKIIGVVVLLGIFVLLGLRFYRKYLTTQIFEVIHTSDVARLRALLKGGADPNAKNAFGYTALVATIARGYPSVRVQTEMVRALLEAGADPTLNSVQLTEFTLDPGYKEIRDQLFAHGLIPNGDYFDRVVAGGDIALIQRLLHEGADINRPYHGHPPLITLVQNIYHLPKTKQTELIQLLLDKGADPNLRAGNEFGAFSVIDIAAYRDLSLMQLLLNAGAKVDIPDNEGHTPLITAIYFAPVPTIEFLLKHGANPNFVDKYGKSPLYLSKYRRSKNTQKQVYDLLVRYGATLHPKPAPASKVITTKV